MKRNYLNFNNECKKKDIYQRYSSYIVNENEPNVELSYILLPEEYSVFSELSDELFIQTDTEQHRFLSLCLQYLKDQLLKIYAQYGIVRILPKLSAITDEDGAFILNWAYTSFQVYFNFEVIVNNSYYGIVAQNEENGFFTNTGKLNEENYNIIIDNILQYVMENS